MERILAQAASPLYLPTAIHSISWIHSHAIDSNCVHFIRHLTNLPSTWTRPRKRKLNLNTQSCHSSRAVEGCRGTLAWKVGIILTYAPDGKDRDTVFTLYRSRNHAITVEPLSPFILPQRFQLHHDIRAERSPPCYAAPKPSSTWYDLRHSSRSLVPRHFHQS